MLIGAIQENKILDFDAIRKHVNRSGSRIYCDPNAEYDAPPLSCHPLPSH